MRSRSLREPYALPYFAYGSNLSNEQMRERVPGAFFLGRAILPDYRLTFAGNSVRWNGGVANVLPLRGWKVPGVLYDLFSDDVDKMDRHEGHPKHYRRTPVTVIYDGQRQRAFTYVRTKSGEPFSEPSSAYIGRILEGYRDHHFESKYREALLWAADASLYPPKAGDRFPGE